MTREGRIGIAQAVLAAALFSTGAILVRWAQDLSPVEVTSLRMLTGDALALASGLTFAIYSLLGRRERRHLPLLTYASWVYLAAGVVTAPFATGLLRRPVESNAIAAVIAMALVPSALGHTLYNAALRRLHPSIPNLIAAQEVTGGILLAWVLLGEAPTLNAVAGAGITLIAVALVLL